MVAFRKTSYRKKTPMKKRVNKRKSAPKATFAKRVKTVISRMTENKTQNFRGTLTCFPYTNVNWVTSVIPMTPDNLFLNITQGVGQGQRVGNSISVKSLKLSGVLRPLPYSATTNPTPCPLYVKFFFLTKKELPTDINVSLSDLFQYGNSSEGPGDSSEIRNMNRMINTDSWTVHTTRTYKLGYGNYGGTGSDIAAQTNTNNDFKMNHFVNVDLTKYCVKNIKFNDNNADPTTRNIIMYPIVYTANGSVMSNAAFPAQFSYALDIVYEDL